MKHTDITLISVTYNTRDLIETAINSIRKHCGKQNMFIVDGSERNNDCYKYLEAMAMGGDLRMYSAGYNIGHGHGLDLAMERVQTPYALMFDSDIEVLKDPIPEMLELMDKDTYGVGWITEVGRDGYDYGTWPWHKKETPIKYLHPYFALVNIEMYHRFKPLCHHGAPFFKSMVDLHDKGEAWRLKAFKGLTGHTSGQGANWIGTPSEYVRHDFGGTRKANKARGKKEIFGQWEK